MQLNRKRPDRPAVDRARTPLIPPHEVWDLVRFCCRHRTWLAFGGDTQQGVAHFCPMDESAAHRLLRELSA